MRIEFLLPKMMGKFLSLYSNWKLMLNPNPYMTIDKLVEITSALKIKVVLKKRLLSCDLGLD